MGAPNYPDMFDALAKPQVFHMTKATDALHKLVLSCQMLNANSSRRKRAIASILNVHHVHLGTEEK